MMMDISLRADIEALALVHAVDEDEIGVIARRILAKIPDQAQAFVQWAEAHGFQTPLGPDAAEAYTNAVRARGEADILPTEPPPEPDDK